MKKHFTLIEILVVVFLIGVLTAIGFGMYSYAMNSAKESATRALLKRLETALETCNTKYGYIPPTVASGNNPTFKEIQFEINDGPTEDGTIKSLSFEEFDNDKKVSDDYLKEFLKTVDAENLKKNLEKKGSNTYTLVDNWGNPICYAYPGKFNKTGYDLYSAGADGRMGKDDKEQFAEKNAEKLNQSDTTLETFKDSTTNEMLCDDICNF